MKKKSHKGRIWQQEINDKRITTIEQLKRLAEDGMDCFILLNGGLRSSKHIRYFPEDNSFYIFNYIDETCQQLTEDQIFNSDHTNIGKAMKQGALIMD